MASSLGYIHVAIPLNISTYQHQITLFHDFLADFSSKTTSNPTQVSFTKAIRDLATFARKRVDKLVEQLRFIDVVLPEDDLTNLHHPRQKRFLWGVLGVMLPTIMRQKALAERELDLFHENCTLKDPSVSFENVTKILTHLDRKKRSLVHDLSSPRRQFQMLCYLNMTMQTTTPLPYPDYPEFHEVFVNETFPTTTTTTPPPPSHKVFHSPPAAPPPNLPYPYRRKRDTSETLSNNDNDAIDDTDTDTDVPSSRDKRQILAGIAAAGGVLGTIFGLFNQLEMPSIQNHVSNMEASTNMLIHVQHKNQQQFKIIAAEMAHLTTIIETLIQYNPALVYAKLMSQVDDIADHLNNLLDTVQQLQHQKLSIRLLDLQQLNTLHNSLKRSHGHTRKTPSYPMTTLYDSRTVTCSIAYNHY